jgi:O-antigen/teichoic acid export membrane protein
LKPTQRSSELPGSAAAVPPRTNSRIWNDLAAPLFRNAYLLIVGASVGSGFGFLFWALAARHYSPEIVGRNSAAVAAMMVVSGICQLGLNAVLVRYLPTAGTSTRRLVLISYALTAFFSAMAGLVAALTIGGWAPTLRFLGSDGRWVVTFVLATVAWTIFSLQDSVMTGMRQARWVPIENSLFSAIKVVLLVALASAAPRGGIFIAWNLPVLVSLLPVNLLIFRRLIPRHVERGGLASWHPAKLVRFGAGNYVGSLFFLGSTTLLPVVVASQSGAKATAYFYIPWTIASALQLVALNMTTSLTVEVAFDETKLRDYCRRVMLHTMRLVLPMTVVLVAGAPYVLRAFGDGYESEGATLLRLLGLATIPNVIVVLGLSVARIQHNGRMVLWTQGALCTLTLGLSILLLPPLGIEGVGLAWLASQVAVGAWLLGGILRPVVLVRARSGIAAKPSARSAEH